MTSVTPPTTPTPPVVSPLDWFTYESEWGADEGQALPSYWLRSEVNQAQSHQVVLDEGVWVLGVVDVPGEFLTMLDALTFADELQRCIVACAYLNGQQQAVTA